MLSDLELSLSIGFKAPAVCVLCLIYRECSVNRRKEPLLRGDDCSSAASRVFREGYVMKVQAGSFVSFAKLLWSA